MPIDSISAPVPPLNHLRIIALLGEGSFGSVYKAENLRGVDDYVPNYQITNHNDDGDQVEKERHQPKMVAVKVSECRFFAVLRAIARRSELSANVGLESFVSSHEKKPKQRVKNYNKTQ